MSCACLRFSSQVEAFADAAGIQMFLVSPTFWAPTVYNQCFQILLFCQCHGEGFNTLIIIESAVRVRRLVQRLHKDSCTNPCVCVCVCRQQVQKVWKWNTVTSCKHDASWANQSSHSCLLGKITTPDMAFLSKKCSIITFITDLI